MNAIPFLPVPPRPLKQHADAELEYERLVRRGPRYRCSGCGWFSPETGYQPRLPRCPVCQEAGRPDTYTQRFTGSLDTGDVPGCDRDWILAVAAQCGRVWGGEAIAEPDPRCSHCHAGPREHTPDFWWCGASRVNGHRSALCYQREIQQLTDRLRLVETPAPTEVMHE